MSGWGKDTSPTWRSRCEGWACCVGRRRVGRGMSETWSVPDAALAATLSAEQLTAGANRVFDAFHRRRVEPADHVESDHVLVHLLDAARTGDDRRHVRILRAPRE